MEKNEDFFDGQYISYTDDFKSFMLFSYLLHCAVVISKNINWIQTWLFQITAFYFAFFLHLFTKNINCVIRNTDALNDCISPVKHNSIIQSNI